MKIHLTALKNITIVLFLILLFTGSLSAQTGITFTFANPQVTGGGAYFEFDIMATATANSQFKLAQIYIDYNTAAFGSNISGTSNLTITPGALLNIVNHSGSGGDIGSYVVTSANNTASRLAIQNSWQETIINNTETGYDLTNTLGTTPVVYVHVKMAIQDQTQSTSLSFDNTVSQFDLQQYYFTSGNNETQYSPVDVGSGINQPLPVELKTFTAKPEGENVDLAWQTATEVQNYGFEIQRKLADSTGINKISGNDQWVKIGFVKGADNSNAPKEYSFIDNSNEGPGSYEYRLKQIDIDGHFKYSKVINIKVVPEKFELFQNYPNPFNPTTNIRFDLPKEQNVVLEIYNMLGQRVRTLINSTKQAGRYTVVWNGKNNFGSMVASGIYIYTIRTQNFSQTMKMILLK